MSPTWSHYVCIKADGQSKDDNFRSCHSKAELRSPIQKAVAFGDALERYYPPACPPVDSLECTSENGKKKVLISSKDQKIQNSIRLLKSEIKALEALLQDQNHQSRASGLKNVSNGMLLSAQRVNDLIWTSYR